MTLNARQFVLSLFAATSLGASLMLPANAVAEQGDDNPTGVAGGFNGEITTGCAYDSYTGNARRTVDDIVVPGSIGAYPLKWTRHFNSHLTYQDNKIGGYWRFSYLDYKNFGGAPCHPDGRRVTDDYGVEESALGGGGINMADGGKVLCNFNSSRNFFYPVQIIDPYGQVTTLSWVTGLAYPYQKLDRVTEPGGRYLKITWDSTDSHITRVDAFDGVNPQSIQWVAYTWQTQSLSMPDGTHAHSYTVLTRADYSDGTSANYTYTQGSYPIPLSNCSTDHGYSALLATADDVRYAGPMRQIKYQYYTAGNKTRVSSENNFVTGQAVSTITGLSSNGTTTATETRGDGPTRTFHYHSVVRDPGCTGVEPPPPLPLDGKLLDFTDFQNHTTTLTYETDDTKASAGFITAVTDANNHTARYTRSALSWAILRITHPDGSYIDQTYTDETHPYYLASRTDENIHRTDYTRDTSNRITRKDYPAAGNGAREYETFTYNSFGQTLTHRMKNGAYEHFNYNSRGLLLAKTNPTWNSDWAGSLASDPQTTFTYYTSSDYNGVWTDRIKTATDPRGLVTQYDYDRTLDANGENSGFSTAQTPVSGRGTVTRITHMSDGANYQSFGFNKYANKLWEENELRQRVTYTYDDYRRVLTIKNALNQTVTNTYTPTNGTNTSSYVHTTSSIYTTTTPTGIVTKNIYDANFRKTSTTQAYGTSLAASTTFGYDPVGNPTTVTDPLNHTTTTAYDTRNRKITMTNALNQMTQWFYDNASNATSIQRADGTTETKTYDQMNRVLTDTVPQTTTVNVTTTFTYYPGNVQYGGLPQQVIDADGHITTFSAYDPSGLKTTVTYPNGDSHGFSYDNDHNMMSRRTVNGTTQNFTYDNRNRKITMAWTNPTNVANFTAEWANFGYDAASRLISAQNGIGTVGTGITSTITRSYDTAGRLTLDRQNLNATLGNKDVQYAYDNDGKDTRLYVTSAGYDYTFSYDAMGRFEKIYPTGSAVAFQYYYDAASNEVERYNYANAVGQFYTRDALDRMSARNVKLNATILSSEAYGYDAMSRMLSVAREDGKTDAFTYYLDGELWTAQYGQPTPTRTVTYNIDRMGNRTSLVDTGVTTTYTQTAAGLNQYAQVGTDAVGNDNQHAINSYRGNSYTYINDERLSSIVAGANNYQLLYDALGRCVKRTVNGSVTYYIYDGEKPIVEYNSGGSVIGRNLYGKGIDEILLRTDATFGTYYYQNDHEGSVTQLTGSGGTILERYRYDVFGAPTILSANNIQLSTSAINNRFMFTGREYASTFGIYEYRARAYHPGLGRFTGEDPKGFDAGDYNLFRYCHNDPEDLTDPMGLDAISVSEEVDRVSLVALRQVLQISERNLDGKGFGWERAKTVGIYGSHARASTETTVGKGVRFTGPQSIQPPDRPDYPKGKTGSYVHNHTTDTMVNGTITSPGDKRNVGDASGKPIYTIARVGHTNQTITERYLPSDAANEAARVREGGATQRLNSKGEWSTVSHGSFGHSPSTGYSLAEGTANNLPRVNPFGAFQSSPFGNDAEGGQAQALHPVPRALW